MTPLHPHIRLFARSVIQWKEKDITTPEHKEFIAYLEKQHIQSHIQQPKIWYQKTSRKLKPFDCEFSYYSWDTIKSMAEFYGGRNEG